MEQSSSDSTTWAIIITAIIAGFIGYGMGLDNGSSNYSKIDCDECSACQDELEQANGRISELEDCNSDMGSALSSINFISSFNAWEDYYTMGDALDEIDSNSASYDFCSY